MGAGLSAEVDACRKQAAEADARKTDKRELVELKAALQSGLASKAELSEVQGVLSKFSQE